MNKNSLKIRDLRVCATVRVGRVGTNGTLLGHVGVAARGGPLAVRDPLSQGTTQRRRTSMNLVLPVAGGTAFGAVDAGIAATGTTVGNAFPLQARNTLQTPTTRVVVNQQVFLV
jgi:hypothetical protein